MSDREPEQEIFERSAAETDTADALTALVAAARDAAARGLVKHTYVVDDRSRVKIDARDGRATVKTLDEATVSKIMGGKDRPLRPDRSAALLREIGIMNPDGSISARHAKKYKQVNHLVELCRPVWERVLARTDRTGPLRVLDLACGNSVLDFVLAEALGLTGIEYRIHGIDARADVIERSRARAQRLDMGNVQFTQGSIAEEATRVAASLGGTPDVVVALHACDTATDDAIAAGVQLEARAILVAPCCQRELAVQLGAHKPSADPAQIPTPALVHSGLLRREYAAVLTDGVRVDALSALGYKVDTVEFVPSEHTPKNLLIRAFRRPSARSSAAALAGLEARMDALGVRPHLLRVLSSQASPAGMEPSGA